MTDREREDRPAGTTTDRRRTRVPVRTAGVGLAAAVGLVTGLRAVASVHSGRIEALLRPNVLDSASLGVEWSERAVFPSALQSAAGTTLVVTVGVILLACALTALLNAVVVLAEGAAHRRAEYAVRSALGEAPRRLTRGLLREVRTLLFAAVALGLLGGVGLGFALRATWPHLTMPFASGPLSGWDVVVGVAVVVVIAVLAHLGAARRATAPGRAIAALRAGNRSSADPAAIFFRNGLAAFHVVAGGSVVIAAVTLAGVVAPVSGGATHPRVSDASASSTSNGAAVRVLTTRGVPTTETGVLAERIRAVPGIEAESLASPGALLGLGIRDIVVTQCGNCWRGLFPAPLWNELADHHAVGPGYFASAGVEIVQGRGFLPSDDTSAEPVAIVDISLARTAFEGGEALGRKLRVGRDYTRWYTVVGVARLPVQPTLGADTEPGMAVWLNASQQPVEHPRVLLAGTDAALVAARSVLTDAGLEVVADRSLESHRAAPNEPIEWAASVARSLSLVLFLLIALGLSVTALQTTRRRFPEVALRQALGATPYGVVRFVLGERLRVTAWGLAVFAVVGPAMGAAVHVASGADLPGLGAWFTIAAALTAISCLASIYALRGVLLVEPRLLLEE